MLNSIKQKSKIVVNDPVVNQPDDPEVNEVLADGSLANDQVITNLDNLHLQ